MLTQAKACDLHFLTRMLFSTPQRAALISVASNTLLVAAKIAVAFLSGSAALLSEALHSGLDLLASFIAWLSLHFAAHPPDREHPYGHGKWENVSAFLEGLLILGVALWVFYEAGQRLFTPVALTHVSLAMAVLGGSALVNLLVSQAMRLTPLFTFFPPGALIPWLWRRTPPISVPTSIPRWGPWPV